MKEKFSEIYSYALNHGFGAETAVQIAMQQALWELFCIAQGTRQSWIEEVDPYLRNMMRIVADRFLKFGDGKVLEVKEGVGND